jgi:hypothetical protein
MRKKVIGFLSFGLIVVVLIGAMKLVDWVPSAVQSGFVEEFRSIDEVTSRLKITDIYIPSYFPQNFKWPPTVILAQTKPYTAIVMEFRDVTRGDVGLTISQVDAGARFISDDKIGMSQIREQVSYPLKGRNASLEVGADSNDEPCSRISWIEGKYRITVAMRSRPFELLKIAESMLR